MVMSRLKSLLASTISATVAFIAMGLPAIAYEVTSSTTYYFNRTTQPGDSASIIVPPFPFDLPQVGGPSGTQWFVSFFQSAQYSVSLLGGGGGFVAEDSASLLEAGGVVGGQTSSIWVCLA